MCEHNLRVPGLINIAAQPPRFVLFHIAGYLVGRPPLRAAVHGCILRRRIVWNLILEEVGAAALSVPQHLVLLLMLDEEAIHGYIVCIDNKPVCRGVDLPAGTNDRHL